MNQGLELERYHKHQMQLKLQQAQDEKLESLRERKELLSLEKSLDNEFAHQQIDKRKSLEEMVRQQTETEEAKLARLRELRELDVAELRRAEEERDAFARRQKEFEEAFEKKIVGVGKRQVAARKW